MSETTDFYLSWLGDASFGLGGRSIQGPEPTAFSPTDISNCSVWLDATDNLTIQGSGNNVEKWFNKGDLSGSFIQYDIQAVPTTNTHTINGNNAIWFDSYQTLYCPLAFPNQEFTLFVVTTTLSDLSVQNYADWFGGYTAGAFSSSMSEYLGTYYTGCGANAVDNYVMIGQNYYPQNVPVIYAIRSSSDLSSNILYINNVNQPLDFNNYSGYNTNTLDYYIHIFTHPSSFDIGEIIVYNRAITDDEIKQVTDYLSGKFIINI